MVDVKARITGQRVELVEHDKHTVTVKGNIDAIYFITPSNVQTIFEVDNENDVQITFNGNSLHISNSLCNKGSYIKGSNEDEVIIGGDIISFDGNVVDDKMRQFLVIPYGVVIEENVKIHWTR